MALKDAYLFIQKLKGEKYFNAETYLNGQCYLSDLDDEELIKAMDHIFGPGCELLQK
ncbi:hypothetical protein KKB18_01375 [bacterium]|nr:hypothetical protein [bacterium]